MLTLSVRSRMDEMDASTHALLQHLSEPPGLHDAEASDMACLCLRRTAISFYHIQNRVKLHSAMYSGIAGHTSCGVGLDPGVIPVAGRMAQSCPCSCWQPGEPGSEQSP